MHASFYFGSNPIMHVYSSGSNLHGQLAHGLEEDSHCFNRCMFYGMEEERHTGSKILSIVAGANHTLLLLRSQEGDSQLWGCGDGRRGQLGTEYLQEFGASSVFRRILLHHDVSQFTDCDITLVAASWETSFVVLSRSDGDLLLSAGSDDFGDLGVGGVSEGRRETGVWRSVGFSHLLPKNASNIRISQLKAGPHNALAKLLYRDSSMREVELVVGWGAARQGQLGQGHASKPQAVVNSPKILLGLSSHISAFAVGNQHTLFLTSEGTVVSFGSNRKGQLCGLDEVKNICAVAATWNGTYLLQKLGSADKNWAILATGSNPNGQLALDSASNADAAADQLRKINLPAGVSEAASLSITCGSEHVLLALQTSAQVNNGEMHVFAWGWNEHGNLGLGHTLDVHEPTRIWPSVDHQQKVVGVWAGCATSWIVVEDG